jgi:hypothetical protein
VPFKLAWTRTPRTISPSCATKAADPARAARGTGAPAPEDRAESGSGAGEMRNVEAALELVFG